MRKIATSLPGLLLLEPRVFGDDRGFFLESYNQRVFAELGIPETFVQDNHSYSEKNVVRGLHYQIRQPQGKLVRVVTGEVLDVALDLRRNSSTFGKWEAIKLSGENNTSYGFHADLLTASGSCQRRPTSSIRQPISMRPSTNARWRGTTRR